MSQLLTMPSLHLTAPPNQQQPLLIPTELVDKYTMRRMRVYVPNRFIGAVIGAKGCYIKMLQNSTNTNIRVEPSAFSMSSSNGAGKAKRIDILDPKPSDSATTSIEQFSADVAANAVTEGINALQLKTQTEFKDEQQAQAIPQRPSPRTMTHEVTHRCVHLTGHAENILKAVFWLFQRVAEVNEVPFSSIRMHAECSIPASVVGKVIGKAGHHIQHLRQISRGCDVHVSSATSENTSTDVYLYGAYGPCLAVICRINLLQMTEMFAEAKSITSDNYVHATRPEMAPPVSSGGGELIDE